MRLPVFFIVMLVAACSGNRGAAPIFPEAAAVGTVRDVLVVTNRVPLDGVMFGPERSFSTSRLQLGVSVPPSRAGGTISDGEDRPDPERDFTLVSRAEIDSRTAFRKKISDVAQSGDGSVTFFTHGYNNTFVEPVYRIAQLAHDLELKGALMTLAWPSRGSALGYQYDTDST